MNACSPGAVGSVVALCDVPPLLRHRPPRYGVAARRRAARPRRGARQAGPRRRGLPGHARDRVPRVPVVAPRRPRAAAAGHRPGGRRRRALRHDASRGLGFAPRRGRHAGRRLHRHQRHDPRHALRRRAHEGRRGRPVPRQARRPASVGRHARARPAHQRPPRARTPHDLARPERRQPAPARLPHRQGAGRSAAQGEPRGGDAAVRGVAAGGRRRGQLPRPALRVGHAARGGGLHGRRHRPRSAARRGHERLRVSALARTRHGRLGTARRGSARAQGGRAEPPEGGGSRPDRRAAAITTPAPCTWRRRAWNARG